MVSFKGGKVAHVFCLSHHIYLFQHFNPLPPRKLPHILPPHILNPINLHPRLNLIQQPLRALFLACHAPLLLFRLVDLQVELFEVDGEAAVVPFEAFGVPLALLVGERDRWFVSGFVCLFGRCEG